MLAIDVGNTHITSAVIEEEEILLIRRIATETCLKTGTFLDHLDIDGRPLPPEIVLSSVRRPVSEIIVQECERRLGIAPFVVTNETPMGITNLYGTIDTLGTDRLVDAAACYHLHTRGKRPGIVIDMGTATTIDYITEKGEFLGGAIAPGLVSAYRGLLASAPELPEIGISRVESAIGTTTKDCIRVGVIAGHAAMVQALSSMMAKAGHKTPLVVYTGGLADVVETWMPREYVRDELLTLRGLSIIYRINMKSC
jgi:type III pantothenate kinase